MDYTKPTYWYFADQERECFPKFFQHHKRIEIDGQLFDTYKNTRNENDFKIELVGCPSFSQTVSRLDPINLQISDRTHKNNYTLVDVHQSGKVEIILSERASNKVSEDVIKITNEQIIPTANIDRIEFSVQRYIIQWNKNHYKIIIVDKE